MMHSRPFARVVAIALASVLLASVAAAQSEPSRIVFQDTVVVRSSKLQIHLADLATSAAIISPLELRRSTSSNLQDQLARVPGVHIVDLSGSGTQGLVESRGFASQGFSSHTLVLIDEMPINNFERDQVDWNLITPAQIDHIEFLRGPSSFLYGNPSMSGVVNLVTTGATLGSSAWFQGVGGSEGQTDGMGGITWGGARASGGVSGSHRRIDGYRDHSEWRASSGYGFASVRPADRTTLRGRILLQRADQDVPGPLPEPEWKTDPTRSDTPRDTRDTETFEGALSARVAGTPNLDVIGTVSFDTRAVDAFETIVPAGTLERTGKSRTLQGEMRGHWAPGVSWLPHMMLGGDLRSGTLESRYRDPEAGRAVVGSGDVERLSGGMFALAQLRPRARWTLTAGVRGDWLRSSVDDPNDPAPRSPNDDLRAFSPTAGVSYALPGGNAHVSYAGSFKAPTLEQLYDQRPYFVDFDGPGPTPPFVLRLSSHGLEPQRGNHFEGGFRTRLASGLWGDATVYYARSTNEIGFDLATFRFSNIDKSIHYGFEGQIDVAPHGDLSGSFSYAWTIAEFDGGAHDGKQINTVPEHQVFARASYAHRWGGSVTGELRYVANQWIDEDNTYELDPYAVANLGLTQDVGLAGLFVSVRNLFDERYATLGFVTIDAFGNDLPLYYPAQSRSFRAGVRIDLDALGGARD